MKRYFETGDKVIKDKTLIILLLDFAKQRGIHPDKLLKGSKLFESDLSKPELSISHSQFTKVIVNAKKLINKPELPFLLGSRLFPTQLGFIGLALSNSRNLEDMLRIIKAYQSDVFPFMFLLEHRQQDKRFFIFNHAIAAESDDYHLFMCELLATAIITVVKWHMGNLPALKIRFSYQQPTHIEQYHAYFGECAHFLPASKQAILTSKKNNVLGLQITIASNTMKVPFHDSNQIIKRFQLEQSRRSYYCVGIIQFTLESINKLFSHGNVTQESIAESLGISLATLKRKLASHNTCYQQLLDLYRQQQAVLLLTEFGQSNDEIASALKFSDITNFRRSFKRWTGLTPNELKMGLIGH